MSDGAQQENETNVAINVKATDYNMLFQVRAIYVDRGNYNGCGSLKRWVFSFHITAQCHVLAQRGRGHVKKSSIED